MGIQTTTKRLRFGLFLPLFVLAFAPAWTAAQTVSQWKAGPNAPRASAAAGATCTTFRCPFDKADRVYWDTKQVPDLSRASSVELRLRLTQPSAFRRVSLHFQSGAGWYTALFHVTHAGDYTLRLPLGTFDVEGKPAGWDKVSTMRLSGWKGNGPNASFDFCSVTPKTDAITIYKATSSERSSAERSVARRSAQRISQWLNQLGISHGMVTDESFRTHSLDRSSVLILPYNRTPGNIALQAIRRFQKRGGKTIGFHDGPSSVTQHVGVKILPMIDTKQAGTFNAFNIQLDSPFPERVYQHVWNVMPLGTVNGGRVVGRWENSRKQLGRTAAVVRSANGFWFGQVFRDGDASGKQQLLLAMLGELHPAVWREAAADPLARIPRDFNVADLGALYRQLGRGSAGTPQAQLVDFLPRLEARARQQLNAGQFGEAYKSVRQLEQSIARIHASQQRGAVGEMRGVWDPLGAGLILGDWDATCKKLRDNGFNTLFPCMMWGGKAHYPSQHLPKSGTLSQFGDQLGPCLVAAKRHDIDVHVWKICWSLDTADPAFRWKVKSEGRMAQNRDGTTKAWLCPSHPANRKLERDAILEVARKYPELAGIHLDYLRYSGSSTCYALATRKAFEAWRGSPVRAWPPPVGDFQFQKFRADQITSFLADVRKDLRAVAPNMKLSVAVWPSYPQVVKSIGQDYGDWLKRDLVDFLCPMNYTADLDEFRRFCQTQNALPGARGKIIPGIAAIANEAELPAREIIRQVNAGREMGLPGFVLFKLDHVVAEHVLPLLSAGLTKDN